MTLSKPLTEKEILELDISRWETPAIHGPTVPGAWEDGSAASDGDGAMETSAPTRFPTAKELEQMHQVARDEGFSEGRGQGYLAGREEGERAVKAETNKIRSEQKAALKALTSLLQSLSRPLDDLDAEVTEQLCELVTTAARHVIRRELQTQSGEIMAVIRDCVAALPVASRNVRVHVNPEDFLFISERLKTDNSGGSETAWRLLQDPALSRGGCTVRSDTSFIDATVEQRLNQITTQILGCGRARDRERPLSPDGEAETATNATLESWPPAGTTVHVESESESESESKPESKPEPEAGGETMSGIAAETQAEANTKHTDAPEHTAATPTPATPDRQSETPPPNPDGPLAGQP